MKKLIILAVLLLAYSYSLTAQTSAENAQSKYVTAMESSLQILDTALTPATLIILANNFERIGNAEKNKWQPFYYAAFCYAVMAGTVSDNSEIDPLTEKASSYLAFANELEKNNSEISSLHAMILYIRVLVDPIGRWQTLGTEATELLERSKNQDPSNPRPWLIEARAKLHIPEAMGGGSKAAGASINECIARFKTFLPGNSLAPVWGKAAAEKLVKDINPQ